MTTATEKHACVEHLVRCFGVWTEPHGEPCSSQWFTCSLCMESYEESDVAIMRAQAEREDETNG